MIVGTAGHIDHGKTTLVRALTGVDTDRLPEEKRRGITIELGFAPLTLPGGRTAGLVDVPGHEAFVRTMLAGATGIDIAVLVVAADEGVMPQTREHLAILRLLGVPAAVVAITKADLADEEWLALVRDDVRALVADTALADAAIVATSATTGAGLDALRGEIAALADRAGAREREDLFRLPIDRVFTVRGTGTVVTGTAWSGRLARDAPVRVLPGALASRVRALESHGEQRESSEPGSRLAVALAGLDHQQIARGQVLVADAAWRETRVLRADVSLLDDADAPLRPRTRVRLHLGTSEVGARVVAVGGPLAPGELRPARLVLDAPLVARAGDRFVLRASSPVATIGGGVVSDPHPPHRRARPWPAVGEAAETRLAHMLAEAAGDGVEVAALPVRLGLPPREVGALLGRTAHASVRLAGRLYDAAAVERSESELIARTRAWQEANPLDVGAPLAAMRASGSATPELADEALRRAVAGGGLETEGGLVRTTGWSPRLSADQAAASERIVQALREAGAEPPSVGELMARHGSAVPALLRILERRGVVVPVESDRFWSAEAADALVERVRSAMSPGREYAPAELREMLGLSRKFLIPFLEFCDRRRVTDRRGTGRVLHGT